jgi:hypothetical protein
MSPVAGVKCLLLAGIVFGFTATSAAMIGQWPGK